MEDNENQQVENEVVESKTYTEAEVNELKNQMKEQYEKSFDEKFNKRWGKEMRNIEKRNAKTNELISLLESQTGKNNIDELLELSYEQYGVEKPTGLSDKDLETLGKLDAKEILDGSDYDDIEQEANRLADIGNRTPREQAMFMELGSYLTEKKSEQKRKQEMKEAGIGEELFEDNEFKDFLGKFNNNTPLSDIYKIYKSMNAKAKPFSTGSLKDTKSNSSEVFTLDEFLALTSEDLKNPTILEKALKSKKFFK